MIENQYLTIDEYKKYTNLAREHHTFMNEKDDPYIQGLHPFIDYIYEDKSGYKKASEEYIDEDDDFLIGDSGGILMNIDFIFVDTHLFTKVADDYMENIKKGYTEKEAYCGSREGTIEYNAFWLREYERRKHGMSAPCKKLKNGRIVPLHITGDHYNYLNYGRINRTPSKFEYDEYLKLGLIKGGKIEAFPRFWDGDYWNFKLDMFIARNGLHLAKAKARRKGFSFKRGSQAANTLNIYRNITVIFLAYDLGYLKDTGATTSMAKLNLDWYEKNTHWSRGYGKEDIEEIVLGYKKRSTGNIVHGWKSKLLSFGTRTNTSAAVGKDAIEIDLEEAGAFPNIQETTRITMNSTEQGALQSGTMRWYGTAGTKGANWSGFKDIFYNPRKYKAVALENVWDKNARMNVCGFFFPQIWNYEPFVDKDGNSLLIKAFKYDAYDKLYHEEYSDDIEEHNMYVGQRANSPEEAFSEGITNIFSSPELSATLREVQNNKSLQYYRDGQLMMDAEKGLIFRTNAELAQIDKNLVHPYITDVPFNPKKDIQGCIREYHRPFEIDGVVPANLYGIVYDPVGKDKSLKEVTTKNSLNSIHVFMLPNNISNSIGDILVASYVGRMETMEDVDKICYYLALRYNAKALVEVDRGETVKNFKMWKALNRLYKDPRSTIEGKESPNAGYGIVIGNSTEKDNALIYLKDFLYEPVSRREDNSIIRNIHYFNDEPTLKELTMFNNTGNFDRISSLRLYPYLRSYVLVKNQKAKKRNTTEENRKSFLEELYS